MTQKLTNLLRKVFLSSLAGIAASNTINANTNTEAFQPIEVDSKVESFLDRKTDLSPKLLLKMTSNDEWSLLSHRSHRSHQSHRSHYSSYSGGESSKSKPAANPGIQPNNNNRDNSGATNSPNSASTLQLGARTLKKGMAGTDVTELVNILLKKEYLILDDGGTHVTGIYTFDETIESVVKKFQTDNGLTSDGVCGPTTIYYLKNKEK